ncbi:MAG: hypothetical protein B6245_22995 [Desulfobacteraceae bacterium 4572_88]|nr:MAG: hypothetical protein B6245_22995 [Desulfobacteraceae bacterium 4572_88]
MDPQKWTYKTGILYPGTYYLLAKVWDSNYMDEWWDGKTVSGYADPVTIFAGEYVTGKDFSLDIGNSISGTVYAEDGVTPITSPPVSILAVISVMRLPGHAVMQAPIIAGNR